jgi:hypothetical protein
MMVSPVPLSGDQMTPDFFSLPRVSPEMPNSPENISSLCSPTKGARREICGGVSELLAHFPG